MPSFSSRFFLALSFVSRDDVFHGDDDFAGKSSSSSVHDDALNEDDATRMMQKKQQQLLIHRANNRHAAIVHGFLVDCSRENGRIRGKNRGRVGTVLQTSVWEVCTDERF